MAGLPQPQRRARQTSKQVNLLPHHTTERSSIPPPRPMQYILFFYHAKGNEHSHPRGSSISPCICSTNNAGLHSHAAVDTPPRRRTQPFEGSRWSDQRAEAASVVPSIVAITKKGHIFLRGVQGSGNPNPSSVIYLLIKQYYIHAIKTSPMSSIVVTSPRAKQGTISGVGALHLNLLFPSSPSEP